MWCCHARLLFALRFHCLSPTSSGSSEACKRWPRRSHRDNGMKLSLYMKALKVDLVLECCSTCGTLVVTNNESLTLVAFICFIVPHGSLVASRGLRTAQRHRLRPASVCNFFRFKSPDQRKFGRLEIMHICSFSRSCIGIKLL